MDKLSSILVAVIMAAASITMSAHEVDTVRVAGPFTVLKPYMIDTVDAKQKKLSDTYALDTYLSTDVARQGRLVAISDLNADSTLRGQLLMAAFTFSLDRYTKLDIKANGPKQKKIFVNGKETTASQGYQRGQYDVVIKYIPDTTALTINLEPDPQSSNLKLQISNFKSQTSNLKDKRPFSLDDVMEMRHLTGLGLSPSGNYATISTWWYDHEGKQQRRNELINLASGTTTVVPQGGLRWMPKTDRLIGVRTVDGKKQLVSYSPADFSEQVLCADLPLDIFTMSPTEEFLILTKYEDGPERESGVYEVLTPDDRQPGWRSRSHLAVYDLRTGLMQPLTYGHSRTYLADVSRDGRYALVMTSGSVLGRRPTEVSSLFRIDLQTLAVDTLLRNEG
ncbi:MAG: hypothetical protein J6129_00565, partial [Bacteroidaceae bacterium]|nr:hypothetical protein [Bacteroidaceae bacterium]